MENSPRDYIWRGIRGRWADNRELHFSLPCPSLHITAVKSGSPACRSVTACQHVVPLDTQREACRGNPMKREIHMTLKKKIISCLTVNTPRLHYKDQPVKPVAAS